jgi:hypothetical protein
MQMGAKRRMWEVARLQADEVPGHIWAAGARLTVGSRGKSGVVILWVGSWSYGVPERPCWPTVPEGLVKSNGWIFYDSIQMPHREWAPSLEAVTAAIEAGREAAPSLAVSREPREGQRRQAR